MFSDMPNAWDERNEDTFGALEGEDDDNGGLSEAFAAIGTGKRPDQDQVNQVRSFCVAQPAAHAFGGPCRPTLDGRTTWCHVAPRLDGRTTWCHV